MAKPPAPGLSSPAQTPQQARQRARLAEALKANLKRRKSQARGRRADAGPSDPSPAAGREDADGEGGTD